MGRSASEDKYKSHGGWCWFLLLLLCNLLKVSYEWFTNQGNKVNEEKIERKKKTKKLYEFKGSVVKRRTTRGIILDDVHKSQADVHIVCRYNCNTQDQHQQKSRNNEKFDSRFIWYIYSFSWSRNRRLDVPAWISLVFSSLPSPIQLMAMRIIRIKNCVQGIRLMPYNASKSRVK